MFKYVAAAIGFFGMASVVSKQYDGPAGVRYSADNKPMEDVLSQQVAEHNKRRGEKVGSTIFAGASLYGRTMVLEFTMPNAPAYFDVNATTDRLLKQMTDKFCIRKYHAAMRDGGAIVYRYQTEGGRVLVDAKVDATVCRRP